MAAGSGEKAITKPPPKRGELLINVLTLGESDTVIITFILIVVKSGCRECGMFRNLQCSATKCIYRRICFDAVQLAIVTL